MLRYIHLIIIFLSFFATTGKGASASFSLSEYEWWAKLSTDSLMTRGMEYLISGDKSDSALICYTIVTSRYKSGKASRHELYLYAKALNNMGFLFAGHYLDYEKAYSYLTQSLKLSQENRFSDNLPYVYLNLAAVYENRKSVFGISDPKHDALKNMQLAFKSATKEKEWNVAFTCFTNLLNMVAEDNTLHGIQEEIRIFKSIFSRHPTPMGKYAMTLLLYQKAYCKEDYGNALHQALQMKVLAADIPDIGMECELSARWKIAKAFAGKGDFKMAETTYGQIADFIREKEMDDEMVNLYEAYNELYQQMGDKEKARQYDYLYLKEKDNLFHRSNVEKMERSHFVNEINSVNEQMEQLNAKRRNLWITLVAVIIFCVVIAVALALIIRGFFRQRAYIKILYEKNLALAKAEKSKERKASTLDEDRIGELCDKIDRALLDNSLICSPDFSLQQLAEHIGSNYKYVSQVINDRYQKNFRLLVNEARVKEACRRLGDPEQYGNLTIEAISTGLGFKSRSNFAVTFKKITGISPSDFQKMAKK
ncbi:AraC family transcriptional regulator [uncultured Prevotella sp.]|uniref:helix-turn-helix domain-containing protein n=1 Tax=uncultured Prevotella sp. TaxID=159272 RepID=UPI0025913FB9|nr:AraC family transcriptional regulator [uncultured Prevotella sp.]